MIKLSKIKPNPDNPRLIKDERFKKLVQSIKDFPKMMELRPIITDEKGMILGGNMRLKAIQEIGMKEIPDSWVKKASDLSEEQKREFIIKDNIGFGDWEWETLANNWDAGQLEEWGLEIPGFAFKEAVEDDYEIPDEIKTDIVTGDLFEIGQHRLLCGDSTNADDVAKVMKGVKADLGLCDPPYNIGFEYNEYKDDKTDDEYFSFCLAWFNELKANSVNQIITCGKQNLFMWGKIEKPVDYAIWYARNKMSGGKISNLALTEPILFYGSINRNARANDFYDYNVKQQENTGNHSCPKILPFFGDLIKSYSIQSVLDLFLGSGTTMVAAHQLNRKCIGIEISPQYCQIIVERMLKLDPTLEIKRNGKPYVLTKENQTINA